MRYVNLGDICSIKTGKLDANASSVNGKYPFFTCSKEPLSIDTYSYDCECVLVAGNGDLNVKYYNGKFDAYQRTYIIEINDKEKYKTKYIYILLESNLEQLRNKSIGGVIKYIKLGDLTSIRVPDIQIKEQEKIIDSTFKLYELINIKEKQTNELDKLIKSQFIEMFGDPVLNEKKWDLHKFDEIGDFGRGVSKHRPRNAPELLNGPYPLIQTGDVSNSGLYINNYNSTYSVLGLKQSKMWPKGTLCITIAANIAQTGILNFDACFPDSVVGFSPREKVNSIFIHYWFSFLQKIIDSKATQVAQKNINLKILSELDVIVPPVELQNKFAEFVEKVNKQKSDFEESLKKLEEMQSALMQEYFG